MDMPTLPSVLTEAERSRLLVEWNETSTPYPRDKSIAALFEAQVERTPDAVAVVSREASISYREMERRANQLACHLRGLGVDRGTFVGVCLDRSADLVVAFLATLKAGGAYVPLDPSYPAERLAFMLQDTRARVLLTEERLRATFPAGAARVVCLDSDWPTIAREPEGPPEGSARADDLAYVIYTSGSTGTPKGVAVPHRAIARLVLGADYVQLAPDDVVAQASNAAFDAATFEIWGALLNGARLTIVPHDVVLSPPDLAAHLARHRVTTLFLTTALFNQCAHQVPTAFRSLRHLLFGGEAVEPRWVAEVLRNGPPERLLHVYGPTETTTFATWYRVESVPEQAATIPIGRPIANTQCLRAR